MILEQRVFRDQSEDQFIEILVPVLESECTFLQVEREGRRAHSSKTSQTEFGKAPESFNAIEWAGPETNGSFPSSTRRCFPYPIRTLSRARLSPNDALKSVIGAVRDDPGIDVSVPFEKAKNNGLPKSIFALDFL